jgi:ribosomal protein S18 acetylase RimI-like enzyme
MNIRPYQHGDKPQIIQLWKDCGLTKPQNDPAKDIMRKIAVQPELFLVGVENDRIIASIMAGYEGHRGWLNYLAVSPDIRQNGLGRQMVSAAEKKLGELGCPKINLQVRTTNAAAIGFYRKIGYEKDKVVSLGKRLEIDD